MFVPRIRQEIDETDIGSGKVGRRTGRGQKGKRGKRGKRERA
jgi:hypothetical protein